MPPLHDQPSVLAGLRDHLNFVEIASIDGLLERSLAIEITLPQPLIAIAENLPPPVSTGPVPEAVKAQGRTVADRLLGDGLDDERLQAYLPFERRIGVSGTITGGSLAASAVVAGVPAPAMLEALQALETSVDLAKEMRDGDRFYVRYERTFTQGGAPLDVGRVLWMELRTPSGVMAIHRFRTRDNNERFWMASGQSATPPVVPPPPRYRFDLLGLRPACRSVRPAAAAPCRQAAGRRRSDARPARAATRPADRRCRRHAARRLGFAPAAPMPGLSSYGGSSYGGSRGTQAYAIAPRPSRSLFMHEGVDLVASSGTPVRAAADGLVVGAAPNGRYGNWVRIEHGGKLATVYGHMLGFAPGLQPGMTVSRGDVIGFVGSTGRSTGAHLHFELQVDGKPVNPITHPELKRAQLRGPDFERFRKQVAASLAERDLEAKAAASVVE